MYESEQKRQLPSPSMCFTLRGRVRGTLGPPSPVTPTHKLKACKVACSVLPLFMYRIECASTSHWPVAMLISTCSRLFFCVLLSHFCDCDILCFLGDVYNGRDNDFMLGLVPAGLIVLFPVSLCFLLGFALGGIDTKGDHF